MTFGIQPRIVAATLLSHEFQEHVGQWPEDIVANAENGRGTFPENETEPARPAERGEVDFGVPRELPPSRSRQENGMTAPDFLIGVGFNHADRAIEVGGCEGYGVLRIARPVANLTRAEEDLIGPRGFVSRISN
jgi:hypothetical protein